MSKVKVFTLAKRFGYKSSDFVGVLRDIGFPVSSYQASIEEWDVPVIEERLRKGGLLNATEDDAAEEGGGAKENGGEASAWDLLKAQATANAEAAEAEAAEAEADQDVAEADLSEAEPEPAATAPIAEATEAEAAAKEVAVEEPAGDAAEALPPAEPVPTEAAAEADPADPVVADPAPAEALAADAASADASAAPTPEGASEPAEPAAPAPSGAAEPASEPTVQAGAEPTAESTTEPGTEVPAVAAAAQGEAAATPPEQKEGGARKPRKKGTPTPKPRRAATKVGKIDLAALGLIKSQHQEKRRSTTFSDIRDRVATNRREQRTRQRETMRARRQGRVGPKHVSTLERKKDVVLDSPVTVKSFSVATGISINDVMRKLMQMGMMASINAVLEGEMVELLAEELDLSIQYREEADIETELMAEIMASRKALDESSIMPRDPVIAFLGHVDHGKTSLIDAIRKTHIADKESGGITQHIGAYQVKLPSGQGVTVLDTPGHAAFTSMRARGAQTTDIVVLVVAADDGVMPQTEEAANHARAAGVPVVVAINKVDATGANPEQVKSQLAGLGLQPEDWGGDVGMVEVSALRKQGVEALLERVMLEAEVLDLQAHAKGDALGTIIEAKLEKGRGKMITVLVQDGTLKPKDVVLAGPTFGKLRLMFDSNGKALKQAGPSTPVEISGLEELPPIGEKFYVVKDAKAAKAVAEKRMMHRTELDRARRTKVSMQNVFEKLDESNAERLRFVLKGDVQGSVEVLKATLEDMSTEEVIVDVVHSGVGAINESDVTLAQTAGGVVIAFHVAPDNKARVTAEKEGIEIRRYDVIYDLIEDVQKGIEGLLAPDRVEEVCGHASVLEVFRSSRWGTIAGCMVDSGVVRRSCKARLIRDGKPIYTAALASLRRFKDDVREVTEGTECGLKLEDFEDIKAGDELEFLEITEKARSLEEAQASTSDKSGD